MKEFILYIKNAEIPNVNAIDFTDDVYMFLNSKQVDYSAIIFEIMNSSVNGGVVTDTYRVSIVDKLNSDESNLLDIFDTCKMSATKLLNYISEKYDVDTNISIDYIKQDFNDKLAGIYFNINIITERYYCDYA